MSIALPAEVAAPIRKSVGRRWLEAADGVFERLGMGREHPYELHYDDGVTIPLSQGDLVQLYLGRNMLTAAKLILHYTEGRWEIVNENGDVSEILLEELYYTPIGRDGRAEVVTATPLSMHAGWLSLHEDSGVLGLQLYNNAAEQIVATVFPAATA